MRAPWWLLTGASALTGHSFRAGPPGVHRRRCTRRVRGASSSSRTPGTSVQRWRPRHRLPPAPPDRRANAADGSSCATAPTTECRWNRLDALFGYFAANGLDSVELFGHAGLPANENIEGPYGWKQYRALLDKHGLHAAGWHGSMNEAAWPARVAAAKVIGLDYIGSGGVADPGPSTPTTPRSRAPRR